MNQEKKVRQLDALHPTRGVGFSVKGRGGGQRDLKEGGIVSDGRIAG